jgi:hypothetical protein
LMWARLWRASVSFGCGDGSTGGGHVSKVVVRVCGCNCGCGCSCCTACLRTPALDWPESIKTASAKPAGQMLNPPTSRGLAQLPAAEDKDAKQKALSDAAHAQVGCGWACGAGTDSQLQTC